MMYMDKFTTPAYPEGDVTLLVAEIERNRKAIAELVGALTAFRDSGPSGGQDFLNWHESYRAAIEKARAAITKYGD